VNAGKIGEVAVWKVNPLDSVLLPPGVTTVTSTVAKPILAGVWQVIEVSLTMTTVVAVSPPKVIEVAPVNPVPVMVTAVAVSGGPVFGATLLTTGAARSSGSAITVLAACGWGTVADVGPTTVRTMAGTAAAGTVATTVATTTAVGTAVAGTAAAVPATAP
jgi:hypothetical protein